MSAARKLQRKLGKPARPQHRSLSSNREGRSFLLGAAAKNQFGEYTKIKIVVHKNEPR